MTTNSKLVDVAASLPALSDYLFAAVTPGATILGFFLDIDGYRVGDPFSYTMSPGTVNSFTDVYGATLPSDIVGALVDLSGDITVDIYRTKGGGDPMTALTYLQFPTVKAGTGISFGRVA